MFTFVIFRVDNIHRTGLMQDFYFFHRVCSGSQEQIVCCHLFFIFGLLLVEWLQRTSSMAYKLIMLAVPVSGWEFIMPCFQHRLFGPANTRNSFTSSFEGELISQPKSTSLIKMLNYICHEPAILILKKHDE